jgi:hypothetical protein
MTQVRMSDFEENVWTHNRGYLSVGGWQGDGCRYRLCNYRSPHGIVEIYEQIGRGSVVSMRFIHNGQDYIRRWNTSWGDKTIARLARELVESVVADD